MKKRILSIGTALAIISLTSFAYTNWNSSVQKEKSCNATCNTTVDFENNLSLDFKQAINLDLVYKVESRFMTTITKEQLHNAKSVIDIFPKKETDRMESYEYVKVTVMEDDKEVGIIGRDENLTDAQLELLKSTDYSTNFYVRSNCKIKNQYGQLYHYDLVYYMTIVPEKEAEYIDGQDAMIAYLKESLKTKTAIITENRLQPGRVNFTVTKEGTIANVALEATSGFPSIDKELVKSIKNMPTKWNPATNSEGEKVDQTFVFFFGRQGC